MSIGYSWNIVLMLCVVLFSAHIRAKECGTRTTKLGIVNGTYALENEFPWQAIFVYSNTKTKKERDYCGGTILSDSWVITAAHCLQLREGDKKEDIEYFVKVGAYRRSKPSKNQQIIKVKKIYCNPKYENKTMENDMALLELSRPIGLDRTVLNAICLGKPEHKTEGKEAVITGWGTKSQKSDSLSDVMKRATVTVENNEICRKSLSMLKDFPITDGDLCAGRETGHCYGDSGGPLQYEIDGRWYLLGVISRGEECGSAIYPSVYTRVPYYLDYIKQVTGISAP